MRKCLLIFFTPIFVISAISFGQIPQKISYQGLLTTGAGLPIADGAYDLKFEIFNLPSGGILRHTETQAGILVQRGTFSVILGSVSPLTVSFNESLYVQVTLVAGPAGPSYPLTFSPRSELTSAPYSLQSVSLLGPSSIASGVAANAGGSHNRARGNYSVVSGGGGASPTDSNSALGDYSAVGGGLGNSASGFLATVGGGAENTANGEKSTVGGGVFNSAGDYATVSGGLINIASGYVATVSGGSGNSATSSYGTVGGGWGNTSTGYLATIPGGQFDSASGTGSFAAGSFAKARHDGSFVWSDGADFGSTAPNQFLIHADGGVGIGTNTPGFPLTFANTVGDKISLWGQAGANYGFGIQGYLFQIHTNDPAADIAFGSGSSSSFSEVMRIKGTGNVGIGTTNPLYALQVGNSGDGTQARANAWNTFSDRRFKKDIVEITDALEKVTRLRGVSFNWIESGEPSQGFIAQEVEDVLPKIVSTDKKGYKSLDYSKITPVLVEAIKEQQKEIESHHNQIEALRQMIQSLLTERKTVTKSMGQLK